MQLFLFQNNNRGGYNVGIKNSNGNGGNLNDHYHMVKFTLKIDLLCRECVCHMVTLNFTVVPWVCCHMVKFTLNLICCAMSVYGTVSKLWLFFNHI